MTNFTLADNKKFTAKSFFKALDKLDIDDIRHTAKQCTPYISYVCGEEEAERLQVWVDEVSSYIEERFACEDITNV